MSTELVTKIDQMHGVVELFVQGNDPTAIAKKLGITRAAVITRLEDWKQVVATDTDVVARAKETLAQTDIHYAKIIREFWKVYEAADVNNDVKAQNAILKNIATTEADRVKLYAQAGLSSDNELAAQQMELERKQKMLMDILREVTGKCPRCSIEVKKRLSDINKQVEVIEVMTP